MPDTWDDIHIRPGLITDLPELVRLEKACFTIPWSEESLRLELTGHSAARVLVAELPDGSLAGYASLWIAADEGQITNLAVDPIWRRRKIGCRLMDSLIQLARSESLALLVLEVRRGNLSAKSLYASAGFISIGVRKAYYEDNGEDAIIMLKKLNEE